MTDSDAVYYRSAALIEAQGWLEIWRDYGRPEDLIEAIKVLTRQT